MRYGFVIDHNRCIGCHACTVACKDEHNVPVGVFRTWVKYIEKGEFPDTSRHFGVMRCNHCDNAPCVEICPTTALFRRDNGIVDFDNTRCIGCKSCMQACPYDALYLDPESHTAAKCNFCAHRVELNLEPACVVVCPTRAIIAGDLDDPQSPISNIVATQKVAARKPHKGTRPKLFYAGIEGDFLEPSMMEPQPAHMFADVNPAAPPVASVPPPTGSRSNPGAARVVYDVAHPHPWGMIPAFYLWTKSIAGGLMVIAGMMIAEDFAAGDSPARRILDLDAPLLALVFIAITTALLIGDLDRPDRFYYILLKPNLRSWLIWGTWILMGAGFVATLWLACGLFASAVPAVLGWLAVAFGFGAACYSAMLFAQAKGRDLWQSPLFLWHLAVQAAMAGAASLILIDSAAQARFHLVGRTANVLPLLLVIHTLMILAEMFLPKPSEDAHRAARIATHGSLRAEFWLGAIGLGAILPFLLLLIGATLYPSAVAINVVAALATLLGLLIYERVWIIAGQSVPLS